VKTDDAVALIGAIVLFLGGAGGFIASLVSSRNLVKKADADTAALRIKTDLDAYRLLAERNSRDDRQEFDRLKEEVERLEKALTNRRTEIEDLSERMRQMRKELDDVRVENAALRVENAKLRVRVAELEKQSSKPGTGPLAPQEN